MDVFITEKPSVAQEYARVLKVQRESGTDGYISGFSPVLNKSVVITWAVGHLIELVNPEYYDTEWKKWNMSALPIIPSGFKYGIKADTKKQYDVIKSIYKNLDIDTLYYAGDSGREGIYIQALIRNQIFFKGKLSFDSPSNVYSERVVWIDSFTEESILNGIRDAKPYTSYRNMVECAYARAITDWVYGINFTRAVTLKNGTYGTVINVGRVKSPTLAMVVDRQREIDAFTKTYYYGVKTDAGYSWKADKNSRFYDSPLLYNENGFLKQTDAENLRAEFSRDMSLTVSDVKVTPKTEYAPYQFNLADLQSFCSKNYHISPKQTLDIAQSLYEKKLTTYPRTDARFLSSAVAKDLEKKFGYKIPNRYIDDSKITDHYAIIPTFENISVALNDFEEKVFKAIKKRFDDMLLPPYVYDSVSVTYLHSNKERFYETYKIVKQKGFKNLSEDEEKEIKANAVLPKKGDRVSVGEYVLHNMETRPPAQYTTGSLVMAMEKAGKLIEDEELREQIKTCGIGTSATRAGIIDELVKRGFMETDKSQKITPTEFGKKVIDFLSQIDETFVSPVKTAEMEQKLEDIASGSMVVSIYYNGMNGYVTEVINSIKDSNPPKMFGNEQSKPTEEYDCPCCNKTLKYGKFGFYCDKKEGGCGFSLGEICGHKFGEKDLKDLIEKGKTKDYQMTSKAGNKFTGHLVFDEENKTTKIEFGENKNKYSGNKYSALFKKKQ